uniref:Uncharacterized protein n=1 Tax=Pyxicephalus adspersus TaxID=30357 RepID=A0AAV3AQM1_PYXAD|nr:TPA: hypothetical protein GDO54_007222 [Pyxicephalus adspersus]
MLGKIYMYPIDFSVICNGCKDNNLIHICGTVLMTDARQISFQWQDGKPFFFRKRRKYKKITTGCELFRNGKTKLRHFVFKTLHFDYVV